MMWQMDHSGIPMNISWRKKDLFLEQGLEAVFTDVVSVGVDAHKNSSPFETFFFGKLRTLTSILNNETKKRNFSNYYRLPSFKQINKRFY